MLKMVFKNEVASEYKLEEKDFESLFKKSIKEIDQFKDVKGIIQLNIVKEKEITKLNKKYRKKNKSTDVLSFSFLGQEKFPGDDLVGEIFICAKIAEKQAQEHKVKLKDEAQFLFVHGMLHLSGLDHENPEEFKKMYKEHGKIMPMDKWKNIVKQIYKESFED